MRSKKGVELGVNTMIIIVLALLVLIIIGYLVVKAVGNQNNQTSCSTRGGYCEAGPMCSEGRIPSSFTCSASEGKVCCIPLGS